MAEYDAFIAYWVTARWDLAQVFWEHQLLLWNADAKLLWHPEHFTQRINLGNNMKTKIRSKLNIMLTMTESKAENVQILKLIFPMNGRMQTGSCIGIFWEMHNIYLYHIRLSSDVQDFCRFLGSINSKYVIACAQFLYLYI